MKKIAFIAFFLTGVMAADAQIGTAPVSGMKKPATQPVKVNTMPPANPLPDIIITNISFVPNTANTYFVNYILKNVGVAPVKKGLLSVQSYINGNPSGGGKCFSQATEINQSLNSGESVNSKNTFSITGLTAGQNYTFELAVNGMKANAGTASQTWVGQQFAESNFTNNSIQSTFTIAPPPPPPADILVTITGIEKSPMDTASFVRIYYTLKNIGATAIPPTASLSLQSSVEDTDNDPGTFLGTACCGQATGGDALGSGDIPYAPGSVKTLYYDARVAGGYNPSLPKMTLYTFNIVISNSGYTEGNNANNKSSRTYFLK